MDIYELYKNLLKKSFKKFEDIVEDGTILYSESEIPLKLRLKLFDGSILDIFYSESGKYSYHWERRIITGTVYRFDNAPHPKWKHIKTFPRHFHEGSEEIVKESHVNDNPAEVVVEVLEFIKGKFLEG